MKIDRYLYDLLHHHDCVVIPGFGGFVTRQASSLVNEQQQVIFPRARHIAFNESLKNNDGLLANHIVAVEKISYNEACTAIDIFAFEVMNGLNITGSFLFNKIGILRRDEENKIQFQPDLQQHFLLQSFGLSAVRLPAAIERTENYPLVFSPSHESEKKAIRLKILDFIPVAAMIALLVMAQVNVSKINNGLAGLVFFKNVAKYPITVVREIPDPGLNTSLTLSTSAAENNVSTQAPEEIISTPSEKNDAPPVKASPAIIAAPVLNYHIIAGCFRIEENAVKLEMELNQTGYHTAAIIGKNKKGLTMVSVASYESLEEAEEFVAHLQDELKDGAWIYSSKKGIF